ncbi:GlsB/YeaQ/YmgE family stress response membrane protein [Dyadobacter sp. OTU695]|uniref:GlsB/YeaQ/YmgE family stress response membrane protein n=1 Tax=Dyadobacter sp. OTU695 TaxID=3043860 RepID=UPI00313EF5E3
MTSVLVSIPIGGLAGWLAGKAFSRFSLFLWVQILLGMAGGVVGGWLLGNDLQTVVGFPAIISRCLTAFIGAIVILGVVGLIKGNKPA